VRSLNQVNRILLSSSRWVWSDMFKRIVKRPPGGPKSKRAIFLHRTDCHSGILFPCGGIFTLMVQTMRTVTHQGSCAGPNFCRRRVKALCGSPASHKRYAYDEQYVAKQVSPPPLILFRRIDRLIRIVHVSRESMLGAALSRTRRTIRVAKQSGMQDAASNSFAADMPDAVGTQTPFATCQ